MEHIVLTLKHLKELLYDNPDLDDIPFKSTIPSRTYNQPYPIKARWEIGYLIQQADPDTLIFKVFLYPPNPTPENKPSHSEIWEKREWELSDAQKWHSNQNLEATVIKIDKKLDKVYRLCQKIVTMLGDKKSAEDVARKIVDGEYKPDPQFMRILGLNEEDLTEE